MVDRQAMSCFWHAYQQGEFSERVFNLTTKIIDMCEGHYTVWQYRRRLVRALSIDPYQELSFVRQYTVERPKNYQLWRHREVIVSMIEGRDVLAGEMNDLNLVLLDEPKNYHGWQYRQWLVQRFDAWEGEVAFLDELLIADHYNNSAWNHRYFVLKSRPSMVNWDLEALFVEKLLIKDPLSNQSILNYLYGITKGASEEIKGKFYSLLKSLDLLPSFNSTYNL